jgi:hypothetical protein
MRLFSCCYFEDSVVGAQARRGARGGGGRKDWQRSWQKGRGKEGIDVRYQGPAGEGR